MLFSFFFFLRHVDVDYLLHVLKAAMNLLEVLVYTAEDKLTILRSRLLEHGYTEKTSIERNKS